MSETIKKRTSREIVRINQDGSIMRRYTSIPIAAALLDRMECEVKDWCKNHAIVLGTRWMYMKEYSNKTGQGEFFGWEDTSDKLKEVIRNIEANRQNDPPEQGRGRNHTGCIYSELHNRGRRKNSDSGLSVSHKPVKGVGLIDCYKYRWVAEITINGQRHRCRSAHFDVVRNWLEGMKARCS